MGRFRFKIVDSQGRRRSGILRADSLEVAESALRSKLCLIEQLTPLPEEGQAVEVGGLEASFSQVDRIRMALAVLLSSVCLFSFVYWLRTPAAVAPFVESEEVVEFIVKGELDMRRLAQRDVDPSDVKVYAVFPDLAYEVEGTLGEDGSSFVLPVSLVGVKRPGEVVIQASVDGERWTVPAGAPVGASGDVNLGPVEIQPPAEIPKAPPAVIPISEAVDEGVDQKGVSKPLTGEQRREARRKKKDRGARGGGS